MLATLKTGREVVDMEKIPCRLARLHATVCSQFVSTFPVLTGWEVRENLSSKTKLLYA